VQYVWLEINEILYETTRIGKTEKKKEKKKKRPELSHLTQQQGEKK